MVGVTEIVFTCHVTTVFARYVSQVFLHEQSGQSVLFAVFVEEPKHLPFHGAWRAGKKQSSKEITNELRKSHVDELRLPLIQRSLSKISSVASLKFSLVKSV